MHSSHGLDRREESGREEGTNRRRESLCSNNSHWQCLTLFSMDLSYKTCPNLKLDYRGQWKCTGARNRSLLFTHPLLLCCECV